MPTRQPLAGQSRTGEPLITHDADVSQDIIVVDIIDQYQPDYSIVPLGTSYPGYVSPQDGSTLYSNFVLSETSVLDHQHWRRTYQALPGSWIYEFKLNERSGDIWTSRKRKNVAANITPSASIVSVTPPSTWASGTSYPQGSIVKPSTPPSWQSSHAYSIGAIVQPVTPNGFQYVCTVNGTSNSSEPIWQTVLGVTQTDNTVTWKCEPLQTAFQFTAISNVAGQTSGGSEPVWNTVIYGTTTDNNVTWLAQRLQTIAIAATEREDINTFMAWEIQLNIPDSQYNSLANAMVYTKPAAYSFPARINIQPLVFFGNTIGYTKPEAEIVPILVREYWTIAGTEPTIAFDEIILQTILVNGVTYQNVLVDGTSGEYNDFEFYSPSSIPSFTQYTGGQTLGIMAFTNGSAAVTGTSTHFLTDFQVGQTIYATGGVAVNVLYITDNTNMTLTAVYSGTSGNTYYLSNVVGAGAWIGTYKTIPNGSGVEPERYGLLWRVVVAQVKML